MRKQIVAYILLACLLLAASHHQFYSTKCLVQAIPSVEFNVRTSQPSSRAHKGTVFPTWDERKKHRKAPSGPNPVGNQHPPSRH